MRARRILALILLQSNIYLSGLASLAAR